MELDRRHWWILGALTVLGLCLRLAAAQGGLWLDEAWSAVFARDAGTPLAVLFGINHDNNHHLNSWWLQLVGHDAPPLLQRALAIVTGTGAIVVAAMVGARRSPGAGLAAASLFAVSPILVTYGSEARGYAPMLLALLGTLLIVDRWLDAPARRLPAPGLGTVVLLGMLAQLTMVFGIAAIAGWVLIRLWQLQALRRAPQILAPLLIPAVGVLVLIYAAGKASPYGFRIGSYTSFSLAEFGRAVHDLSVTLLGAAPLALLAVAIGAAALALPARSSRAVFYALAIFAFPLAICILQVPNSGFARYYLLSVTALLLLLGEAFASIFGRWRIAAAATLLAAIGFSLVTDLAIIRDRRGDPGAAMRIIAARHPQGASIAYGNPRSAAVIDILAAQARYPLRPQPGDCPAPDYLYTDTDVGDAVPGPVTRCGARYVPVAHGSAHQLSGMNWTLLARAP